MRFLIVGILGALLGVINSRFIFVGSGISLIPWGILGLFVGWMARSKKEALLSGIVYGFVLSFAFMATGYTGSAPFVTRIPFFTILGLFGALCGAILGIVGLLLKNLLIKK